MRFPRSNEAPSPPATIHPLGGFTVFASAYQLQPLVALSEVIPPCHVAVVAKPKMLNGPFLRPEYVTKVDEKTVEKWVQETIQHTLKRIEIYEKQESDDVKLAKQKYNTNVEEYREALRYIGTKEEEEEVDITEIDFSDLGDLVDW